MTMDNNITCKQKAYDYIYLAIARGVITPGERIKPQTIAKKIGVSPVPTREAIMDMAAMGLLEYQPHAGATVRKVTLHDIRQYLSLRMLIEPYAAGEAACNGTEKQFADVGKCIDEMDNIIKLAKCNPDESPGDIFGKFSQADSNFHMAVFQATNNFVLIRMGRYLMDCFCLVIATNDLPKHTMDKLLESMNESITTHRAIYKLLLQRNPIDCNKAMHESLAIGYASMNEWEKVKNRIGVDTRHVKK